MFAQNTSVDNHAFQSFFAAGDCSGHLCRFPLASLLPYLSELFSSVLPQFASASVDSVSEHQELPSASIAEPSLQAVQLVLSERIHASVPFAVSQEWHNQVWHYQVSLHHHQAIQPLHQHLSQNSLSSIPEQQKTNLQHWIYFASSLDQLKQQLILQPLTPEQRTRQRINHLYDWLQQQLQEGSLIDQHLILPLTSLPLGDGLNRKVSDSLQRVGKLCLPDRQRLQPLNYALISDGRLSEGYGLLPDALFRVTDSLSAAGLNHETLLVLDQSQCQQLVDTLRLWRS